MCVLTSMLTFNANRQKAELTPMAVIGFIQWYSGDEPISDLEVWVDLMIVRDYKSCTRSSSCSVVGHVSIDLCNFPAGF